MTGYVLYLCADRVSLYRRSTDGCFLKFDEFTHDAQSIGRFNEIVAQWGGVAAKIILDVVEEEFQVTTIPHIRSGSARKSILERTLKRAFRTSSFTYAQRQGRDKDGRKDDRLLLCALMNEGVLVPWLDVFLTHNISIAGIFSLPIVSAEMVQWIGLGQGRGQRRTILVTTLESGLRISFFVKGRLKISRLIALDSVVAKEAVSVSRSHVLAEIEKTKKYLGRLRLLSTGDSLNIYVVSDHRSEELFSALGEVVHGDTYAAVTATELANALQLGIKNSNQDCESLFIQFAGHRELTNHYARPDHMRCYMVRAMKRPLLATCVTALFAALVFSSVNTLNAWQLGTERISLQQKIERLGKQHMALLSAMPASDINAQNVKSGVEAIDILKNRKSTPLPEMLSISKELSAFKAMKVDLFRWQGDQSRAIESTRESAPVVVPVDPTEIPDASIGGDALQERVDVVTLEGAIEPFKGDFRGAMATLQGLSQRLNSYATVRDVTFIVTPIKNGVSGEAGGRVGMDVDGPGSQSKKFSIEVVFGNSRDS
ncbi:MAG: hypothetical protein GXP10_05335 [Gammaproteobacteria bacterium]|nr:hypothetical protein [Gammaproteobacteria bacterium]